MQLGLRGMVGQSMGGPKYPPVECAQFTQAGSYTFTAPAPGLYKFVLWGGGGGGDGAGNGGGGSGAYCELTRLVGAAEQIAVVVGAKSVSGVGNASSLRFVDGRVVTAGGGASGAGASGDLIPTVENYVRWLRGAAALNAHA